jgi:hypothetical protein
MKLARYKKALAALLAGAAVVAVSIPLDADPRLVAVGQLVTALAVLLAPRNQPPPTVAPTLFARQRYTDHDLPERPRE